MFKQSVTLGVVAAVLAIPALSQISVYIGIAPPPIRYEVPPPPPEPSFVWAGGFWVPQGEHYRWVAGHYVRPPSKNWSESSTRRTMRKLESTGRRAMPFA